MSGNGEMKYMRRSLPFLTILLAGCETMGPMQAGIGPATPPPATASAEERTLYALDRIAEVNPLTNAVIAVEPTALEDARAMDRNRMARGPLFGMPMLVKDNIE